MVDWNSRANDIFVRAAEIDAPAERQLFLKQQCGGDLDLQVQVESLLSAGSKIGSFLEKPAANALTAHGATAAYPPLTEGPGTVIGSYKLMEQIGEGGFGLVFVAEQQQPVRRKVALKILKPGMDTRDVIARFEAERQALALMDHPNIASVFDGGATDSGRPYFVMELVKGISLIDYCDQQQLTARERLQLFLSVCQAVQHAHSKGIIHRDLKPSNILVAPHDGTPVVKVIDFGIAKAVGQQLTDKTIYTRFLQMVGTPLYMSPEQAEINALDVDIRSDVYSLGVLLYELLTGTTPFDRQRFQKAAYDEIRRIIKEEEPPRPSTRLSTMGEPLSKVSAQRKTEPARLSALVKGELDWIVMRCLEKDRTRRYETANGLARDVERYLKDEPVEACPPTAGYKLRKFARKNKRLLATTAAFAALLLLGIAASVWQAVRATQAETVANENAVQAQDKEREAKQQRDDAQKQRDQAKALAEELRATQARLRSTLYAAHLNLAQQAWEAGGVARVEELLEQQRPQGGEADLRGFEWHYLKRLCQPERLVIKEQPFQKRAPNLGRVAYSPDGKRLVAAVNDRGFGPKTDTFAKVWDAQNGQELLTLKGRTAFVGHAIFSPDGNQLATTSRDSTVRVWDARTGEELLKFQEPKGESALYNRLVAFSPDGKSLASASCWDNKGGRISSLRVWDVQGRQELFNVNGIGDTITFSSDGKHLAGYSRDGVAKVFEAQTGKELFSFKVGGGIDIPNQRHVALSPDGRFLALGGWSSKGGKIVKGEEPIRVWDAQTGKELPPLKGHTSGINFLAFSPDGKRLASTSRDRTVRIWDVQAGRELLEWKKDKAFRSLAFSPDGKHLAAVGESGVRVWDVQPLTFGGAGVATFALSPDGKRLATASPSADQKDAVDVTVWDTQTGRQVLTRKGLVGFEVSKQGNVEVVVTMKFSPDGKRLAGAVSLMAKVWDAQTGQDLATIKGEGLPAAGIAFDGKRLALKTGRVPAAAAVKLWDAQTGQELLTLKGTGQGRVHSIAFSPDGMRLAVSGSGEGRGKGKVIVWDAKTGEELHVLQQDLGGLTFSPDGKRLAGIQRLMTVKVWDAQTGQELLTLKGHTEYVSSVVFSPDGRRLVSAPDLKTGQVKVWSAETGEELLTLHGQGPLAFSSDGHRLFGRAADGTVKSWDATPLPEKR